MHNQLWFERLRRQLVARRLPRAYIDRIVEEMTDHFHDLTEESMKTEEEAVFQLGNPDQVAKVAAKEYRRRTFLGRHPVIAFLTFAISPIFSFFFLAIAAMYAVGCGFELVAPVLGIHDDFLVHGSPAAMTLWCYGMPIAFIMLPSVVLMLLYGRVAKRTESARRWIIVSCGILAYAASTPLFMIGFGIPRHGDALTVGLAWRPVVPIQFVQLVIPLALGSWLLWRQRRHESRAGQCDAGPTLAEAA